MSKSNADAGIFLTELQIAIRRGGADHPEAKQQAAAYVENARKAGDQFCRWNTWCNAEEYLYLEKLFTYTHVEDWIREIEMSNCVNEWEEKVTYARACRQYGLVNRIDPEKVTREMLENSNAGIKGCACSSHRPWPPGARARGPGPGPGARGPVPGPGAQARVPGPGAGPE